MKIAIYLRKSRADEEAERKGEYETLSRHRSTLLKVAREQNLNIVEIKEELISGESIADRPKMLELLDEVRGNKYDAVLVMDIDRLGRGNMQDQGLILDTFKKTNTKIITPRKIYDLRNEWDEEYSEFEAFMARKELKLITRRMQRGRIKSVEEGKFIATSAPFGYKFEYINNKDRVLVIDEEKSEIIKLIYNMYLEGQGAGKIANYLNELGYKTSTGRTWYEKGIRDIIKNKVYCGYVVWNRVERKKKSSRVRSLDEQIESLGQHEPIINLEDWNKAQEIRLKRTTPPTPNNKLVNPLAGLLKCKICGYTLVGKFATTKADGYVKYMTCTNCKDNRGAKLQVLEQEILNYLNSILQAYKYPFLSTSISNDNSKVDNYKRILTSLEKESVTLLKQKESLHDLLERGIYDVDTYLDRSKALTDKIEENKNSIEKTKNMLKEESENNISFIDLIPVIENVLENYDTSDDASFKNKLLKSVIENITYYKEPKKRKAKFEIDVKLKSNF